MIKYMLGRLSSIVSIYNIDSLKLSILFTFMKSFIEELLQIHYSNNNYVLDNYWIIGI